jgi:hypothetical protein
VKFDLTVNLGNILTAAGLFVGFYAAHIQNIKRLEKIDARLNLMYEWFEENIIRSKPRRL